MQLTEDIEEDRNQNNFDSTKNIGWAAVSMLVQSTQQEHGRTDLCCVSLRAAAGMNLQRATCVVFGELDWSPAVHSQAEDRAHRIGQKDSLLCYYLVSPRGSDRDMQDALGLKVSQFVSLMGDAQPDGDEAFLRQSEARDRIRRLVERLNDEE